MKLINKSRRIVLAEELIVADSFPARLFGLLKYPNLKPHQALLLIPSNSIHTFFMSYSISAIFLDREKRVIAFYPCLKPWRISRVYFRAYYVAELRCSSVNLEVGKGDLILWQ